MFQSYMYLGMSRTPQKVAEQYRVSRKHIYALMKKYRWKERLAEIITKEKRDEHLHRAEMMQEALRKKDSQYLIMFDQLMKQLQNINTASTSLNLKELGSELYILRTNQATRIAVRLFNLIEKLQAKILEDHPSILEMNLEETEIEELEKETEKDQEAVDRLCEEIEAHIATFPDNDLLYHLEEVKATHYEHSDTNSCAPLRVDVVSTDIATS
ncbi:MAG: hypothetical protein Kapaf2KO_12550 [Candidatus Kapaibacteriales bacterium]